MPWSRGRNAGFSTAAESDLWLPVAHDHVAICVEAQLGEPGSMLGLYRRLLRVRGESRALTEGGYAELPRDGDGCLSYVRQAGSERVLVALNLTGASRRIAGEWNGQVLVATSAGRDGERVEGALDLAADEALVVDLGVP
jgi:glycosidase